MGDRLNNLSITAHFVNIFAKQIHQYLSFVKYIEQNPNTDPQFLWKFRDYIKWVEFIGSSPIKTKVDFIIKFKNVLNTEYIDNYVKMYPELINNLSELQILSPYINWEATKIKKLSSKFSKKMNQIELFNTFYKLINQNINVNKLLPARNYNRYDPYSIGYLSHQSENKNIDFKNNINLFRILDITLTIEFAKYYEENYGELDSKCTVLAKYDEEFFKKYSIKKWKNGDMVKSNECLDRELANKLFDIVKENDLKSIDTTKYDEVEQQFLRNLIMSQGDETEPFNVNDGDYGLFSWPSNS